MRIAAYFLLFPTTLLAQAITPGMIDRANHPDAGPPILTPEARGTSALAADIPMAEESPGDRDLGVQLLLKRQERARLFWTAANLGVFGTNNAARLANNAEDDVYMSALLGIGCQPALGGNWFLDIAATEEIYRYDKFSRLDFESTQVRAGAIRILPDFHNVVLGAGYIFRRFTDGDFSSGIYTENALALTAQKVFILDRKNSFYIAGTAEFDVQTDPGYLERFEYSAQLGYDFRLTHAVKLSAYYRFGFRDYQNADIDEANHILGVAATWTITEAARIEASASWTDNNNENNTLDYDAGTIGVAANLRIQF